MIVSQVMHLIKRSLKFHKISNQISDNQCNVYVMWGLHWVVCGIYLCLLWYMYEYECEISCARTHV